jgi:acetate kinase
VRARICQDLEWLGVRLDAAVNDEAIGTAARITTTSSRVAVDVVPIDEETLIAERVLESLPVTAHADDRSADRRA